MDVQIRCQPSYAIAYCSLEAGEAVLAEASSMAAMSGGIRPTGGVGPGGIVKATLRRALGGESFFMGRYEAQIQGAWVAIAPRYPGDIAVVDVSDVGGVLVESGALLACSTSVHLDVKYAGLRNMVLREGATLLWAHGEGLVLLASYGAIERLDLGEGETVVIDTGHMVAFSESVKMRVGPLGGVAASVIIGEGLVGEMRGPGSVWIQTRAEQALSDWLFPDRAQNSGAP